MSTKRMVGSRAAAYALCKACMHTRTSAERTTAISQTEIKSERISKTDLSNARAITLFGLETGCSEGAGWVSRFLGWARQDQVNVRGQGSESEG